MVTIKVKRLTETAKLPTKATSGSAGWDIYADKFEKVNWDNTFIIKIGTGLAFEIPQGFEIQVRPRSGLSKKGVVAVLGTIDSDYRGEVCVLLDASRVMEKTAINYGDRIAQLVIQKIPEVEFNEVTELTETERGAGGFGSTGK